jgi:protein-S-isoprenylcysteine O-methyltransferase Ste14
MKDWKNVLEGLPPHLVAWIWSALLIGQMILAFFVFQGPKVQALVWAGWVLWTLGAVFAIVPILTLRARGGVPKGKSYMETTGLVDTGIYAIVRHPQGGTAGLLLSPALALIGQHWLLLVLAALGMALLYLDTFNADAACITKFGEAYRRYMQRVPRVNFLAGLLRLVRPRPEKREG